MRFHFALCTMGHHIGLVSFSCKYVSDIPMVVGLKVIQTISMICSMLKLANFVVMDDSKLEMRSYSGVKDFYPSAIFIHISCIQEMKVLIYSRQ